jgi:glutamyl-tRNA reductase
MNLLVVGCNFEKTPVEVRERLAFDEAAAARAMDDLSSRYGCEAVILSTCNRVEIYVGRPNPPAPFPIREGGEGVGSTSPFPGREAGEGVRFENLLAEFLAQFHQLPPSQLEPVLYCHEDTQAIRHLFRVAAGLDSLIVGEGQISGQVRRAYELAQACSSAGPLFHALFQQANTVAGRVRTETGIGKGRVSVSSVAVDYVKQVFDRFDDKTILVIGAGKMGELTLPHLLRLGPRRILVTNRSLEKAEDVARECQGQCILWDRLDEALAVADIILSTTAAAELIVSLERYQKVRALETRSGRRKEGPVVILDIAVPRDFDPRIHDGEQTCLFNIDDLKRIREETLRDRLKYVGPAEAIVEQETRKFLTDWERRRNGPVIARLTQDLEAKRRAIVERVLDKLNGRLTPEDREFLEGAFRKLQNQFLHGPITTLTEETHQGGGPGLREALRKLFRLEE